MVKTENAIKKYRSLLISTLAGRVHCLRHMQDQTETGACSLSNARRIFVSLILHLLLYLPLVLCFLGRDVTTSLVDLDL